MEETPSAAKRARPSDEASDTADVTMPFVSATSRVSSYAAPRAQYESDYSARIAKLLIGPNPIGIPLEIIPLWANAKAFFSFVYTTLIGVIYEGGSTFSELITEDKFLLVCRELYICRLQTVYQKYTGIRVPGRIPFFAEFKLPMCIAIVINSYGVVTMNQSRSTVYPKPEDPLPDKDQEDALHPKSTDYKTFSQFVKVLELRNIIKTGTLSSLINGNPAWLISARRSMEKTVPANTETNSITVVCSHPDFAPIDAFLSAMMVNQQSGTLFSSLIQCESNTLSEVISIRTQFVINA